MKLPKDFILHITAQGVGELHAQWQGELIRCEDCLYFEYISDAPFPHGKCLGYQRSRLFKPTDYCSRAKPYDAETRVKLDLINGMSDAEFLQQIGATRKETE